MKEENVLTEFDNQNKPYFSIDVFSIIIAWLMAIVFYYFGYECYRMWEKYKNPDRVITCIMYCSVASFNLMSGIWQYVIRYNFIRRSDIKYFELKDDE